MPAKYLLFRFNAFFDSCTAENVLYDLQSACLLPFFCLSSCFSILTSPSNSSAHHWEVRMERKDLEDRQIAEIFQSGSIKHSLRSIFNISTWLFDFTSRSAYLSLVPLPFNFTSTLRLKFLLLSARLDREREDESSTGYHDEQFVLHQWSAHRNVLFPQDIQENSTRLCRSRSHHAV